MKAFYCGPYFVRLQGELYSIYLDGRLVGRGSSRPGLSDCLWMDKFGSRYVEPEHIRRVRGFTQANRQRKR